MRWSLQEIGSVLSDPHLPADISITGVSIDSRAITPGQLFVPIIAERDGHEFVSAAIDNGAAAYLRSQDQPIDDRVPSILVADTSMALLELGRAARNRLHAHVVGVTGSVGKTSVKDMIRAVTSTHVVTHANTASFNNELGVPLTLLEAPEDARVVVVEMGARNVGHIELLCGIARPMIGVITRVAAVHTEIFGSIEQVAQAKGELAEALPAEGTLVLNADDPLVLAMARRSGTHRTLSYGAETGDVRFSNVVVGDDLKPSFDLTTPIGTASVQLGVAGAHMAQNAAAAAAVGVAVGVPLDRIVQGLSAPTLSPHRMDVQRTAAGAVIINDAYNANPTSMAAAIDALVSLAADRRVAVLGVMGELGETEAEDHRGVAQLAIAAGIDVIAVDAPMYGDGVEHVDSIDSAVHALGDLGHTDAVLVKGSRVAGLERLAERLLVDGASS